MECIVTLRADVDKEAFAQELVADGIGVITRSVPLADAQPLSLRNLTVDVDEDEYWQLMGDPRIADVLKIAEMNTYRLSPDAIQTINPVFSPVDSGSHDNWALDHCADRNGSSYVYSHTGKGVDVVIIDSGITVGHTEFNDSAGTSRIVQHTWTVGQTPDHYTDTDGHGTAVASSAAGKTQGFARDAKIYAVRIFGTNAYSPLTALQLVRAWHNAKTDGRPTVVNLSWSYKVPYPSNHPTMAGRQHPVRVASVDAEVESMVADGITVIAAAANDWHYVARSNDPRYSEYYYVDSSENWVETVAEAYSFYYTNQLTPGGANGCLCIGSIGETYATKTQMSWFSNFGTRVDMFAPGCDIQCADNVTVPADKLLKMSGTSFSSPIVSGIACQYLEMHPGATPAEVKAFLEYYGNAGETTGNLDGSANVSVNSIYNGIHVKSGTAKNAIRPYVKSGEAWKQVKFIPMIRGSPGTVKPLFGRKR